MFATGQSFQRAATRDAPTLPKKEAFALATVQSVRLAAMRDAPTKPEEEASAFAMEQSDKCSLDGCTYIVVKAGVYWRHGANKM